MTLVAIYPSSDETSSGIAFYSTGAAAWSLLDEAPAYDGDGTYIRFDGNGYVSCNFQDMPGAISVQSVTMLASYASVGSYDSQDGRLFVKISGTKYYGATVPLVVSGAYNTFSYTWPSNPATGAAWTVADVNALIAGFDFSNFTANGVKLSALNATVSYTPSGETVDATRHTASVMLWLGRRKEKFVSWKGGLHAAIPTILENVTLEDTAAPDPTYPGWQSDLTSGNTSRRRRMAVHAMTIDPQSYTVSLELKEQRDIMVLMRDLAYSNVSSGDSGEGIARFATPGAAFKFTRSGSETVNPNPNSESETVATDVPGYWLYGLAILVGSRYYCTNNTGERVWSASQGTFQITFYWPLAPGQDRTLAYCYHDANNYALLTYDHASTKIKFTIVEGGRSTTITSTSTPAHAVYNRIGVTWTGVKGEGGAAPYTMSLYAAFGTGDTTLEATGVATGAMTEATNSTLDIGSKAGTVELRGYVRRVSSYQYVMTAEEMQRTL